MNVVQFTVSNNDDGSTAIDVRGDHGVILRGTLDIRDPDGQVVSCSFWDSNDPHTVAHGVEALRQMVKVLHVGRGSVTNYALYCVLSDTLCCLGDRVTQAGDPRVSLGSSLVDPRELDYVLLPFSFETGEPSV